MSDATASIYVALIVQVGGIILWLLSRKQGKRENDEAWQRQVVELSAAQAKLWGERMADRDRELAAVAQHHRSELASRDRDIASKDALIHQLVTRGTVDRD